MLFLLIVAALTLLCLRFFMHRSGADNEAARKLLNILIGGCIILISIYFVINNISFNGFFW